MLRPIPRPRDGQRSLPVNSSNSRSTSRRSPRKGESSCLGEEIPVFSGVCVISSPSLQAPRKATPRLSRLGKRLNSKRKLDSWRSCKRQNLRVSTPQEGKMPHRTSLLNSLNSSVPAARNHSNSTISVVTISQPLAFMRSSASMRSSGAREDTASATTKQR
jgi:hypothetical protein